MQMSVPANPPTVHYVLKVSSQLHANVRSSSATIRHAAAKKTQISGFSSFLTRVVKSTGCVFITSHHTDRFAFRKNQWRKHVDSWAVAVHKQRLEAPGVTLRQAENVRPWNATWQDKVETQLRARGKDGADSGFVEGSSTFLSNIIRGALTKKEKSQLETEVIAYILAG